VESVVDWNQQSAISAFSNVVKKRRLKALKASLYLYLVNPALVTPELIQSVLK